MPKRVQTSFKGFFLLPVTDSLGSEIQEYFNKVSKGTDNIALAVWADDNRELAETISRTWASGGFSGQIRACEESFQTPSSLPAHFWVIKEVKSSDGMPLPAVVFRSDVSGEIKEALLAVRPFQWKYRHYLFGAQFWELEKSDIISSPEELRLAFHDALYKERRRIDRIRGRADAARGDSSRRQRPNIPLAIRSFVWERDGGQCVECGSKVDLEFDHIIPLERGSNTERNIRLLCAKCNGEKGEEL